MGSRRFAGAMKSLGKAQITLIMSTQSVAGAYCVTKVSLPSPVSMPPDALKKAVILLFGRPKYVV